MATSPIYNWPEPDNTDLVKNGALAIRTLGNAIDTTMATMVPKTIVDAKGDLIAGTAADTAARLAVGNNGETLVADSSTATGLRYTAGTVQANPFLNSAYQVWQRGTSISLAASTIYSAGFVADRWQTATGANQACTISRQATGDTTNLPNIQYALRYQRNSGQTGTTGLTMQTNFETINSIPFAGKTVTLSFYARKGANYSATSSLLEFQLYSGTGTDQNANITGFTGGATVISGNSTLTTTWQRFTYTGTVAATATQLAFWFTFSPTGTAGAADYYEVTGVQLDIGSVALPFRTYAGTIQGELAACQRYYYRTTNDSSFARFAFGSCESTTAGVVQFMLPVQMRVAPTAVEWSNLRTTDLANDYGAPSSVTINTFLNTRNIAVFNVADTGWTAYRPLYLEANNNAAAHLAVTAEL